jgi:hypothetical protein
MKLYHARTRLKAPANALIYPPGKIYDAVHGYAVAGRLDAGDLPDNLIARCQDGLSKSDLSRLDYLHSFGGIPVFSNRFLDAMGELDGEIEYRKTQVLMGGERFEFNIGRILNRMTLIDYEKSGIGTGDFLASTYFLRNLASGFLIARERNPLCQSVFAVTEDFVNLAGKHRLHILFEEVAYA